MNDDLLAKFIKKFYGYGTYEGDYWFVGMEEGGGKTWDEIVKRLSVWEQGGKRELEDIADYSLKIDDKNPFFTGKYALQTTWNKLIRIRLGSQETAQPEDVVHKVREYQLKALGRLNGETCLLELFPLPSQSTKTWIYSEYSAIKELSSRELYLDAYAKCRANHIRKRVEAHHPKAVVFYSFKDWYMHWWQEIAGTEFKKGKIVEKEGETGEQPYRYAEKNGTKFFVVRHPASKGIKNTYYHKIGDLILG